MSTLMLAPAARWLTARPVATPALNSLVSQRDQPSKSVAALFIHEEFEPLLLCLDYLLHFSIVDFACLYKPHQFIPGRLVHLVRFEWHLGWWLRPQSKPGQSASAERRACPGFSTISSAIYEFDHVTLPLGNTWAMCI